MTRIHILILTAVFTFLSPLVDAGKKSEPSTATLSNMTFLYSIENKILHATVSVEYEITNFVEKKRKRKRKPKKSPYVCMIMLKRAEYSWVSVVRQNNECSFDEAKGTLQFKIPMLKNMSNEEATEYNHQAAGMDATYPWTYTIRVAHGRDTINELKAFTIENPGVPKN